MDDRHHLTLMVRDLSEIAHFARVDNSQYRLLKASTPGSYTFILEGTKELPRRVLHPKRKTIGLRVPDHPVMLALLAELNEPLLTTTLQLPGDEAPLTEGWEIQDRLEDQLELILDAGPCGTEPTTVIDLTGPSPELIRAGRGSLTPFGLD
jgi:tRNA threonylcarbamoyl adenosine modification protein (Sua5/YciO/YrdC/YwlC family)